MTSVSACHPDSRISKPAKPVSRRKKRTVEETNPFAARATSVESDGPGEWMPAADIFGV
jgi:hypothetical protein